jgi:undecaprenyl diphosphate synthase
MAFPGLHVAIIMDGNGRGARARGWPRVAGHREGAEAVRRVVEVSPGLGIGTLTLFAFSSDNWQRPPAEVRELMRLLHVYVRNEAARLKKEGVKLEIIGRRDRLAPRLRQAVAAAEEKTAGGRVLHLRVAVDYSARDQILRAAREAKGQELSREEFAALLSRTDPAHAEAPEADLLIRTGGEQRLSDFLLWECAYAEIYFTERMWPEFQKRDLEAAVREFHARERRFGRIPEAAGES